VTWRVAVRSDGVPGAAFLARVHMQGMALMARHYFVMRVLESVLLLHVQSDRVDASCKIEASIYRIFSNKLFTK
jgi:hypothetical protein